MHAIRTVRGDNYIYTRGKNTLKIDTSSIVDKDQW